MSLVVDDFVAVADLETAIERWQSLPQSTILHHGRSCCVVAREWLFSTDYSQLSGQHASTGPRWLRLKYEWGPSAWPIAWCEAIDEEELDCGALAAITREIFLARGVTTYHVQLIQQYTADTTAHWAKKWASKDAVMHWIDKDLIYHEACAITGDGREIRVWDPSAGWWADAKHSAGYGAVVAMRVLTPPTADVTSFQWGNHVVRPNRWETLRKRTHVVSPYHPVVPDGMDDVVRLQDSTGSQSSVASRV